jgi:hypothetical protein
MEHDALTTGEPVADVGNGVQIWNRPEVRYLVILQGLNSVFSFFFTAIPLIFTYAGRPSLYGG